ncbi:hypothetical protein EDF36_1023 [Rathayibacter sp. PhB152]|nr:hypothetical protein EDF36_1023 [Rathayibacter sp. PhB152]
MRRRRFARTRIAGYASERAATRCARLSDGVGESSARETRFGSLRHCTARECVGAVHADRVARGAGVSRSTGVRRTSLQTRPAGDGGSRYAPAGLLDQHEGGAAASSSSPSSRELHADRVVRAAGVSRSTTARTKVEDGGPRYAPAGLLDQHGRVLAGVSDGASRRRCGHLTRSVAASVGRSEPQAMRSCSRNCGRGLAVNDHPRGTRRIRRSAFQRIAVAAPHRPCDPQPPRERTRLRRAGSGAARVPVGVTGLCPVTPTGTRQQHCAPRTRTSWRGRRGARLRGRAGW